MCVYIYIYITIIIITIIIMRIIMIPARTAQGGGGSFKDRKPIGEVDGCDGWQSKPIDGSKGGCSVGLSFCLSI